MSKITVFVQIHEKPGIHELELPEPATIRDLHSSVEKLGVKIDDETFVFIDESDEHESGKGEDRIPALKHGRRVHVSRCKQIAVTVNFLDKSAMHRFAPGRRVRAVKEWAVRHFKLSATDAAEHVLQLCKSTERPASDTPLHQLANGRECAVCFDLVPEKRVEG